ncbi:flagellar biosynthesis protein FlhB [Helicobacter muridarum]|uniref:Flagellar biosynthetic protein FlhB n=1 Tax=Helicobacter muridarum TaxID=216 RepID=A0A099U0S2_9HELI|nr:flagellar biosynthesis protein FlhB [Helicobacter muridarum]TLE01697.1 flagellar biosynthesis protein FlhB [Helicobacter muridarum]STQ86337.1 flagellar biosynthetic protein [Helicobacter muridarum]
MAEEEKTHAPSQRKIEKAREEGSIAKSPDLVGFAGLVVGLFLLFIIFPFWVQNLKYIYIECVKLFNMDFTINNIFTLSMATFKIVFICVMPFFLALVIAGIMGNIAQFGFLLSFKIIQPKFDKINPIKGAKNLLSLKKLLDGFMITLKVSVAFGIGFFIFIGFLDEVAGISLSPLNEQLKWLYQKSLILISSLLAVFLVMAVIDFIIKRYQYIKSLRMTKQEMKDEFKQQEGNQEIKAKIRQIMMKNAMNKMMSSIPSANVVVTNPTHYAVALRFDSDKESAPVVVAKGIDHLAIRIKSIAREHEILIVENPPLARELYRIVDVDKMIPQELFSAVVELFQYVAILERKRGREPEFMRKAQQKAENANNTKIASF